jgi:hypothetical protein
VPDNFRFDPQVEQVFARSGPDERRTGEEDHTHPGRLQDLPPPKGVARTRCKQPCRRTFVRNSSSTNARHSLLLPPCRACCAFHVSRNLRCLNLAKDVSFVGRIKSDIPRLELVHFKSLWFSGFWCLASSARAPDDARNSLGCNCCSRKSNSRLGQNRH